MALIDPATYIPHPLHTTERAWLETNCYADLWIELLHANGLDPMAMLAFTLRTDFEGDQWTFFKPELSTLRRLYGVQVEELNIWQDFRAHTAEQLSRGRWVLAEVDAWFLPDTAASDYRRKHTKTTVGITNLTADRCDYFHNAGYYTITGEDVEGIFGARELPLYCEFAKFDRIERCAPAELRARAAETLRETVAWMPRENPVHEFGRRLASDAVTEQGLEHWNAYAFSSLRQCGAAFELGGDFLRWLDMGHDSAAEACHAISATSKMLILKGARASARSRALDAADALAEMASQWDRLAHALPRA